jgi:hypothetical protein
MSGPDRASSADSADFDRDEFLYLWLPDDELNSLIENLGLSVRPYNCLKREEVNNLGDLLLWSETELSDTSTISGRRVRARLNSHSPKKCTCLVTAKASNHLPATPGCRSFTP